jgi:hypothetical protein
MTDFKSQATMAYGELGAANRAVLRATRRAEVADKKHAKIMKELAEAKRHLRALLDALQPSFPEVGTLPAGEVHHDPA